MKNAIILLSLMLTAAVSSAQHSHSDHQVSNDLKAERVNKENSLHNVNAEWTDHRANSLRLSRFAGEAVIIVMFYGNCTEVCPILIQDAWRLYSEIDDEIKSKVNVLAVSFDPENDTPEVLKAYAEHEQLDIPGWYFVTAEPASIREMAMLLGVQYSKKSNGHFAHSNLVTVLDENGKIVRRVEGLGQDMSSASNWINENFTSDK